MFPSIYQDSSFFVEQRYLYFFRVMYLFWKKVQFWFCNNDFLSWKISPFYFSIFGFENVLFLFFGQSYFLDQLTFFILKFHFFKMHLYLCSLFLPVYVSPARYNQTKKESVDSFNFIFFLHLIFLYIIVLFFHFHPYKNFF